MVIFVTEALLTMSVIEENTEEKNWKSLLSSLKNALKTKIINKDEIHKILSAYKSKEDDWMNYVYFKDQNYTRNLVDAGNEIYNIIIMAWNPAQGSCIHNHAKSSCFMKILAGTMREIRYETPEEGKAFSEIRNILCERDDVLYIEDSLGVHEMKNDSSNQAMTLHLYIPPIDMCHAYNRKTAAPRPCLMTFTSLYGVVHDDPAKKMREDESFEPCC